MYLERKRERVTVCKLAFTSMCSHMHEAKTGTVIFLTKKCTNITGSENETS